MPSRNVIKIYAPHSYYHVYARGASKQKIFHDSADYRYFYGLFDRYLSAKPYTSSTGEVYPHFKDRITLLAYCLMTNHFHLLVYQDDMNDLQRFMRSVMTSYSRYYNRRYNRSGSVFESRYKAVRVDSEQYLQHISRYIHLNPRRWEKYSNSSLKYYVENVSSPYWLNTKPILSIFDSAEEYRAFVADYEEMRDTLAEIKYQLADQ